MNEVPGDMPPRRPPRRQREPAGTAGTAVVPEPGWYTGPMHADVDRVLVTRERIATRVRELAAEISRDLTSLAPGTEVVLMPVLTGSMIFVADLIRELPHKIRLDVITVSSYPGKSTTSQGPVLRSNLPEDLHDKHVIIVDDILDSGQTLATIRAALHDREPAGVQACVLLRKTIDVALATPCEYIGFDIPDEFVVGYGLDYDHYYRNLPEIVTLKSDAL